MIKITTDLLKITQRLKEIDSSYTVFFNNARNRFEIHNREKPCFLSLCFTMENLDNRALATARRTRKENYDAIQAEIDAHNAEIESTVARKIENSRAKLDDMFNYASLASHDVIFTKPNQWF